MSIYRPILREAFTTAWTRKELWFFGLFAAFLNTGSVLDTLLRTFRHTISVQSIQDAWISAVPGLPTLVDYLQTFVLLPEERRLLLTAIFLISAATLVMLSVNGQANLFHHLKHKKGRAATWWHASPLILGRLLLLNVISRFILMSLGGLAGSILISLNAMTIATNALVTFATLVLFVPLGLLVGAISLLAMVEITLKKKMLLKSVADAWEMIRHHGVAVVETSLLLFLASLLGTLVFIALMMVLAVPYLILVLVSLMTNSALLWAVLTLLGAAIAFFLILLFGGFLTSFIYTTWYLVYQKFALRSAMVSKIERLLHVKGSPHH